MHESALSDALQLAIAQPMCARFPARPLSFYSRDGDVVSQAISASHRISYYMVVCSAGKPLTVAWMPSLEFHSLIYSGARIKWLAAWLRQLQEEIYAYYYSDVWC